MRIRVPANVSPEVRAAFLDVDAALVPLITKDEVLRRISDLSKKKSQEAALSGGNDFVGEVTIDGALRTTGFVGIGMTPDHQLQLSTDDAAKPTTNTWTIVSDERAKDHIRDFTDGLEKILCLRPVTYRYNGKYGTPAGEAGVGVIAQEVVFLLPNSVKDLGNGMLGFNSHELVYLLINAVKTLAARVALLEAK